MKKKLFQKSLGIFWVLLTLLIFGAPPAKAQDLNKLATDLAARIRAMKHDRVTVADFVDLDKKPNKLGKFLTQKLQSALAEPIHGLSVVDQSQLPQLFDQMELLNEGLLDPATGKQLGKVTGVEVVIVGTVMVSSMSVKLDVKAIDLQTAKLITGASDTVSRIGAGPVDKLAKEAEGEEQYSSDSEDTGGRASRVQKSADKPKAPTRSRSDQGIIFELDGCSLSGDELICALTVTSEARDRDFHISDSSRAWNEVGDEFGPGDVVIANSSHHRYNSKKILKNVPTRMSVAFPKFGDNSSMVERLHLVWSQGDYRYRPIDFEKIVIDSDTSSTRSAARAGGGRGDASGGKGKSGGGILRRLGERALEKLESAATEVLDEQVGKLTGNDDEEDKKPPQ